MDIKHTPLAYAAIFGFGSFCMIVLVAELDERRGLLKGALAVLLTAMIAGVIGTGIKG